ncbi:MAG: peptidylprolyl isomerase [Bdellovibrionales bacterium]|nr:peptidylprolyl isomerase [Bdellovibrionales bacterium]
MFKIRLDHKRTPITVSNFIGLAKGTTEVTLPGESKPKTDHKFYDGLIFHRVISGFMIQGGCPKKDGTGGPGYQFADEINSSLRHDKGVISMANAGKNTNGSQFFITLDPTPHLDGRHAVFGKVVEGMDIVEKIGKLPTSPGNDKPLKEVKIKSVTIEEIKK